MSFDPRVTHRLAGTHDDDGLRAELGIVQSRKLGPALTHPCISHLCYEAIVP